MWAKSKDDSVVMQAVKAQNSGQLGKAEALFREAGNQYRNPAEKQMLWDAAAKANRIKNSD